MNERRAEISISVELLRTVLGFPASVDILASSVDHGENTLRLIVGHPALPEVAEGMLPPRASVHTAVVDLMDHPRWAKACMVTGAIQVDGADVILIETLVVREG